MRKALIGTLIGSLIVIGGAVGYLSSNYYTALAEVREAVNPVDTTDAYLYGESLFSTRGCAFCHTLDAAGVDADVGPDLSEIGARADADAIRESITDPNAVIATGCPEEACEPGTMPEFDDVLDDEQINALVTYLSAQR